MSDEVVGWLQKGEADFQNARILLRQRKTFLPDQFGTDIRYPGVSAAPQDARQAFAALKQLRAFVRAKLGLT